jgi:ADP-heptose:LPS heptosyltransferase
VTQRQCVTSAHPAQQFPRYGKALRAMTGKYRARNPALVATLTVLDLLGKLHPNRKGELPAHRPIRVLVANWAHMGDVVVTLPLLKLLGDHPRIERIGVLVGSWSQCVVSTQPFVDKIHCLDHFLLDRRAGSRAGKMRHYFACQRQAADEIKKAEYDVSIDLFSVFPSTHRLMWKAGIPVRIGFASSGLGTYLTHALNWPNDDEYILTKQLRLLEPLLGNETPKTLPATYPGFQRAKSSDGPLGQDDKYVLMHMGSGDFRSWPLANWLELGNALKARGCKLLFTGAKGVEQQFGRKMPGRKALLGRIRDVRLECRLCNLSRHGDESLSRLFWNPSHYIMLRPRRKTLSSKQCECRGIDPPRSVCALLSLSWMPDDGLREIHL